MDGGGEPGFVCPDHHRHDRRWLRCPYGSFSGPPGLWDWGARITINPFATGIVSGFAETSISEGLVSRLIILIVGLALGIFFVLLYADRVKRILRSRSSPT